MKNVLIKSSFILFLFLICCKKNEKKRETTYKSTETCDILKLRNDTISITYDKKSNCILSISLTKKKYTLPVTICINEDSNWNWNIAFACLKDEEIVLSDFNKKYKNIDFDFILYQSRNDELFFKIRNNELFLVAYRYSINDINPLFQIKKRGSEEIGKKVTIQEKLIFLNILVTKTFNTDFVCEYRNDNRKYPFKIIEEISYYEK